MLISAMNWLSNRSNSSCTLLHSLATRLGSKHSICFQADKLHFYLSIVSLSSNKSQQINERCLLLGIPILHQHLIYCTKEGGLAKCQYQCNVVCGAGQFLALTPMHMLWLPTFKPALCIIASPWVWRVNKKCSICSPYLYWQ